MLPRMWYISAVWHEYNHTTHGGEHTKLQHFTVYAMISEGWRNDLQCAMSAALTAAAFFSGSNERSRKFLERHGHMPAMLSKSRFICAEFLNQSGAA